MSPISKRRYEIQIMLAMAIYVVVLLAVWPLARGVDAFMPKLACTLAPVLPLVYVIGVMAQRIARSDELEQRTHLIGLGVAVAVISLYGMVAGFLAVAELLSPRATAAALLWVFPLLVMIYSIARALASRHYGSGLCDGDSLASELRWLYVAAVFAAVGGWSWWREGGNRAAAIMLVAAVLCVAGAVFQRQRRR